MRDQCVFLVDGTAKDLNGNILASITHLYEQTSEEERKLSKKAFKDMGYRLYVFMSDDTATTGGMWTIYATYELAEKNLRRWLEVHQYRILDDKLTSMM